ncbi:MAG: hypothetical protein Kow0074_20220 [Candidatus Zixiibacteriota bacterium]
MTKPEFIDNRDGNTLGEALRGHLDWLAETYKQPVELSIATGYFNPGGFALVADHLGGVSQLRLLLGAEPLSPPSIPPRDPFRVRQRSDAYIGHLLKDKLTQEEKGLLCDRDRLEFSLHTDRTIHRLLELLKSGKVEVRRYEKGFLHGKAFIFSGDEGVIAGSSNFTAAGLTANLELNLGHYQPHVVTQVSDWFNRLWEEASPYDLAAIYAERFAEYPPYLIYLRVLWELYRNDMEAEEKEYGRIRLTRFQTDGIDRALRILEEHNGVIIADGVGLGKTFVAAEIMRVVQEEERRKVLLISPAALRDGTWKRFQDRHQFNFNNISYEQLVQGQIPLDPEDYELIVIDEAQAFRNPSADRAHALRKLLRGKRPKKLVLMSATPVNNSLWDLYYLMTYFLKHDAVFADRGIRSLKQRFSEAQKMDPFDLKPETLFDVLDPVTVRRTRRHVQRWYPDERIPGPEGIEIRVKFPTPHVDKIDYDLDSVLPEGFFEEFEQALMPEDGHPKLTMARYWPSGYLKEGQVESREVALVGLLRSGLLKRFESSSYAFARTCDKLVRSHDEFLRALDAGYVPSPEAMEEMGEMDTDESLDELLAVSGSEPASKYNIERLQRDVESDRDLLRRYAEIGNSITAERSPKLKKLVEELVRIAAHAERDGTSDIEKRDNRKLLLFSFYADTVQWVYEYLMRRIEEDPRLAVYRGRIAAIAGDRSLPGGSRETAVFGFAPRSSEAPPGKDDDRFDILITTDVLAEGMNLQQCRNIINFDLPWNPMRLVQRHGRIDRIGSPHDDVYIWCFFPDQHLDALLRLEFRIRGKLAQAAASIGIESEVIPGGTTGEVVFTETRDEIERLRQGNPGLFERAGEPEGVHSGEEYRQELRKGLEEFEAKIKSLTGSARSGLVRGRETGWFFCARVGDGEHQKVFLRFVSANAEKPILQDTLACLRLIACEHDTPCNLPDHMIEGAYDAWSHARRHIYDEWAIGTDPKNLQPKIRPLFHQAADHLRSNPPADIDQTDLDLAVRSLLAPWGMRYERELRTLMKDDSLSETDRSVQLLNKINELGMKPYSAPDPLPLIDEDEITLVCWMAVVGEDRS